MIEKSLTLALLLSFSVGCGPAEESPDEEGCEHLANGPAKSVTASATSQDAPAIAADHTRYDIALVDAAGGKGGNVSFSSSAHTELILFVGSDMPVKVVDSNGGVVSFESSATSSTGCTEVKGRHRFELHVGTYFFQFGPTEETSVSTVIEPAEHADE